MDRLVRIALLSLIGGVSAVGVLVAGYLFEGFWTPLITTALWRDIAGKATPLGSLVTEMLDHSKGLELAAGGFLLLVGVIIVEDLVLHRRKHRPPRGDISDGRPWRLH